MSAVIALPDMPARRLRVAEALAAQVAACEPPAQPRPGRYACGERFVDIRTQQLVEIVGRMLGLDGSVSCVRIAAIGAPADAPRTWRLPSELAPIPPRQPEPPEAA